MVRARAEHRQARSRPMWRSRTCCPADSRSWRNRSTPALAPDWGGIDYADVREDRLLAFGTVTGNETDDHLSHQGDESRHLRDSAGAGRGDVPPEDPRARRLGNADRGGLMPMNSRCRSVKACGCKVRGVIAARRLFALAIALVPKPHLLDETSFSPCYVDRNGKLLRLGLAEDDRYRVFVPLEKISPQFVEMTLLHEDRYFHEHAGIQSGRAGAGRVGPMRAGRGDCSAPRRSRCSWRGCIIISTRARLAGKLLPDRRGDSPRVPLLEARNPRGLPESRALRAEHRGRRRGEPDLFRQGAGAS